MKTAGTAVYFLFPLTKRKKRYIITIDTPRGYSNQKVENNMKADKTDITRMLKTARGQIDGILKMVEEDRYCIDISNQLMAVEAAINAVNRKVLAEHLKSCVKNAVTEEEKDEKIEEMVGLLGRLLK